MEFFFQKIKKIRPLLLGLFSFILLGYFWQKGLKFHDIESLRTEILRFGGLGVLIYLGFYTLSTCLFFPGTPTTLLAGALWGPIYGTLFALVGATLGATLSFFTARLFLEFPLFSPLKKILKENRLGELIEREGGKIVFLTRLSPLFPFNLLNYLFGLSSIDAPTYILASFFGMLPGSFIFVYGGDVSYHWMKDFLNPIKGEGGGVSNLSVSLFFLSVLSLFFIGKIFKNIFEELKKHPKEANSDIGED